MANNSAVFAEKAALRERLLTSRTAHGALSAASRDVCRGLLGVVATTPGQHVLGYAATPQEVDIDPALRFWIDADLRVCLPWVEGARLGVGVVTDLDSDLAPGWRNVREPVEPRTAVAITALDVLVVPGVGFDVDGNRLGYGGGHFDRLLAQVRRDALVIGVGLDEQVVERIPTEPHDRGVDVLVTPTTVVHCRQPRL